MRCIATILAVSMFALAGCEDAKAPSAANATDASAPGNQAGAGEPDESGPEIIVSNAWVQLPVVPGRPGAAYFNVTGNRSAIVEQITSPAAARLELHQTLKEGNVARMEKFDVLAVGKGQTIAFEPGGKHVMMFDLKPEVRAGQTVPLTFDLQSAPPVTVEAEVRSAGE